MIILIALACTIASVTIRRATFSCRWEQASTMAVCFLGMGLALTGTPLPKGIVYVLNWGFVSESQEGFLRAMGHGCLLLAAASIGIAAASRIEGVNRATIAKWVLLPLATSLAVMGISVISGQFLMPDLWLGWRTTYLCFYSLGLIYLLGYAILALMVLAEDPRQKKTALIYAGACGAGLVAQAGQWLVSWTVPIDSQDIWVAGFQICILLWIAGFAAGAAHSWRAKMRPFRALRKGLQASNNG